MTHTKLKAGDVRQATDEVKRTVPYGIGRGWRELNADDIDFSKWQPVRLVGHSILPADLFVAEFRREVAVD